MIKSFQFTTGLILAIIAVIPPAARAAALSVTADGIHIDAGSMGGFTLSFPAFVDKDGKQVHKLVEKSAAAAKAAAKYEDGAAAEMRMEGENISLAFTNVPADVKTFRMETLIDFSYADGGKWRIGSGDSTPFPPQKPAKPFLFQGNASNLELTNLEGKRLTFTIPAYSYQQLQDNREWNWKTFDWMFVVPYDPNTKQYTITIHQAASGSGKPVVLVDRFGQDARMDFPDKVKSQEELKTDVQRDSQYFAALHPPQWDQYGGLPGSGAKYGLRKTGFFHVEKKGNRWLLADPEGNAFFHLGICGFSPSDDYTWVKGRENLYEWLPAYDSEFKTAFHPEPYWSRDTISFYIANLIRKYGKPYDREEWMARTIGWVRKWGFNSGGAFSGPSKAHETLNFPYVESLPGGTDRLVPGLKGLPDPFDEATAGQLDRAYLQEIAPRAKEPLIIGYYLGNEQNFEDIPRLVPQLDGAVAAKRRLVAMLQEKYKTVESLNHAWGMDAKSFEELNNRGLPVATSSASEDMAAYTESFLEAYYSLIATTFHKYDKNHLLLGSRWQPGTANSEPLVRIAGKYMDIISVNYYTNAVDKDFLTRLYRWSGQKPMFLSEWHYCSPSDSGLPGGKEVRSQEERGLAYRNYVELGVSLGFVVGTEWFTLIDQARSGRFFERYNGENGNTGLLSVADRPWKRFLAGCVKTNYDIYKVEMGERAPFAYNDPRFTMAGLARNVIKIPRAAGTIQLNGQREGWPGNPPEEISGKRLVVGADAGGVEASYRLSWDDNSLYLMAHITDSTPMKNEHKGSEVWNGDGVELFIGHEKVDQPGPMLFTDRQVLLSAGKPEGQCQWYYANSPRQYQCRMFVAPDVDGKGYVLEAAIPFEAFGFRPAVGQELLFDMAVDDSADGHSRTRQLMWNGVERNSSDRSHWGRARLVE